MNELYNYLINLPDSVWIHGLQLLLASTLVATVLQVLKHKYKLQDAKKYVTVLLGAFSFVASLAEYLIQNHNPQLLGRNTAIIISGAVFVHRFAVSPLYNKLVITLGSLVSDAHTYRESIAPQPVTPVVDPAVADPIPVAQF